MKPKSTIANVALAIGLPLAICTSAAMDEGMSQAQANWTEHCIKCHGEDGKGDTKMGRKLRVPDYTDPAVQAGLEEAEMLQAVQEGIRDDNGKQVMKPYQEKLSEEEMKGLVAYIRALDKGSE